MRSLIPSVDFPDVDNLWKKLQEGDRSGLEGIYRNFARSLFQYGLSLVPDEDFVQDCIQEVFIDLWKYHSNLQRADNVKLYLFRSLSHKISREAQKEKKQNKTELSERNAAGFFIESIERDLINSQGEEQLQQKLAQALQKLPLRQKEVIQYIFFETFSYEETSKIMGINLRSVYTLAWKAISSLKKTVLPLLLILNFFG